MHVGSAGMLLGGLLIAIGSLLPWVSTPVGHLSGTVGPGLWTLCAGVIVIAGALLPYRRVALAHAFVPGVAVATLAMWQFIRLIQLSATTDSWGRLLPGIGLVMVSGGAVVVLRAAWRIRAAG
ncbi:hypothetical protein EF847_06965 [Actinobacteria bacterium YIM 96077]|uniref:Uncharacterized protein n=2 Tax=Phytoactinopolyspora halophila TaxID=1981511 RepID=A0A329QAI9_9ACTN|nr:hypothetical protein EF847_06965 [Actinobacteria bacterium YIM 96077]RAW09343.1 hypothetical protein DPM12_21625 [Phytoactinopolyspora halophila]